ncbi:NUDIX domain-containing protein [Butyrivibrio proteoclasticus B316]|uniref:NUDIX domain-containing protein n=1 Tax=Butyrivibrio proteoclasticus (strain ATCC 51982 / DSM 14932 / B316) TaxID=515622 RepID=E0RZ70_BUTPB|nr:NUDIX domain-containing protein [Butyrivibrio proteoclasticus]ADL35442.1 NUDIX domain-containing protein [Butyrivibrio proteoclasticus B316]
MEYIDIFTRDGQFTGVSRPKHDPKTTGEYYRHVLIIMKTTDSPAPGKGEGQYIVQQRSLKARFYPGKWDMTGGAVMAGETPEAAAIRETKEELDITIPADELKFGFEHIVDWDDGTGAIVTVFMCRVDVPEEGFKYDTHEVNDVKIMPFGEFLYHVSDHNDEDFCNALKKIEKTL